jgi:Ca2+-binding RTX toxin-like protein
MSLIPALLLSLAPLAEAAPTVRSCDPATEPVTFSGAAPAPDASVVETSPGSGEWRAFAKWTTVLDTHIFTMDPGTTDARYVLIGDAGVRCAVFEDPAGEVRYLQFKAWSADNDIVARDDRFNGTYHLQPTTTTGDLVAIVYGRRGYDVYWGSESTASNLNEIFIGGGGPDAAQGGPGDDCLIGGRWFEPNFAATYASARERLEALCTPRKQQSFYPDGDDELRGGDGDDILYGAENGPGLDFLDGGCGDDVLYGGIDENGTDGPDEIFGDVFCDGGVEGDDLTYAGRGGDYVDAGGGDDEVYGGIGDDVIEGGPGADLLFGEADADELYAGDQIATTELDAPGSVNELDGGDGQDILHGDAGDDTLHGGDEIDTLHGHAGNDTLYGNDGADTLHGGDDHDRLYGGAESDTLHGDRGDDWLYGSTGDDVLNGGDDDDHLLGEDDDDTLHGDGGDDTLCGGFEQDTYDGGADIDTLIHWVPSGVAANGRPLDPLQEPALAENGQICSDITYIRGPYLRFFATDSRTTACGTLVGFDLPDLMPDGVTTLEEQCYGTP